MNIYDELYDPNGINYGEFRSDEEYASVRERNCYADVINFLKNHGASENSKVLEIGCATGFNHNCHPNYIGIEYSRTAVENAVKRFGADVNIKQDDATKLSFADSDIDFILSYATLEHIPKIDRALNEIDRVLRKKGVAYLAPAWNCRIWTVQKLDNFNYADLSFKKKIAKLLIPLRGSLVYRFSVAFHLRLLDEIKYFVGIKPSLRYQELPVDLDLIKRFGHVADDDAYINIDAHSALMFYASKGYELISHPTIFSRLFCRGEGIIIRKL
ncbi:class I SAM-dependent methyltransferase [Amylibacter sp.]|nr:class I SAM-dependent methyltransferase [Amylibacter sp.]